MRGSRKVSWRDTDLVEVLYVQDMQGDIQCIWMIGRGCHDVVSTWMTMSSENSRCNRKKELIETAGKVGRATVEVALGARGGF